MPIYPHHIPLIERLKTEFTREKVTAELHRRTVQPRIQLVSRWAMITRKMKREEPSHDVLTDFTELIHSCLHGFSPYNEHWYIVEDAIPNLILLLSSTIDSEVVNALKVLHNGVINPGQIRDTSISSGIIPRLVALLSSNTRCGETERLEIPRLAASTLEGVVSGSLRNPRQKALVEAGAIPPLVNLTIRNPKIPDARRVLVRIALGDDECREAVMKAGGYDIFKTAIDKKREWEWDPVMILWMREIIEYDKDTFNDHLLKNLFQFC